MAPDFDGSFVVGPFKCSLRPIDEGLLQLDIVNFPAGIRFDGHYEDHLNMDVVKIFRLTWPALDEPTRQQARAEISRMLDWCVTKSLQPDGSFKVSELDDTTGDAFSYGVSFLNEAGYLRRESRFWTDQDFPESHAIPRPYRSEEQVPPCEQPSPSATKTELSR